jgi:hypothetical protein
MLLAIVRGDIEQQSSSHQSQPDIEVRLEYAKFSLATMEACRLDKLGSRRVSAFFRRICSAVLGSFFW